MIVIDRTHEPDDIDRGLDLLREARAHRRQSHTWRRLVEQARDLIVAQLERRN